MNSDQEDDVVGPDPEDPRSSAAPEESSTSPPSPTPRRYVPAPRKPWVHSVPRSWIAGGVAVAFVALIFAGLYVSGNGGIVEVESTEVAVIVNYWTGDHKLVTEPGYQVFIPGVQSAFKFDAQPQKFLMKGEREVSANQVEGLQVRANDGSNFSFDTLEIQYQIIPSRTADLLDDSGTGDLFKRNWVRSFARSVLRDEFGKYSVEEVADPTNYRDATEKSRQRMNQLLEPHGLQIIQIITPRPKFDPRYEKAIEDRKLANQEVERLRARLDQLKRERERRLAEIDRDMATEFKRLGGELKAFELDEERKQLALMRDADAYKIQVSSKGLAERQQLEQRARAMELQARKEAQGLQARVEALAKRGDVLVREALAQKLKSITFNLVPYRRDPAPVGLEHTGAPPATLVQEGQPRR